MFLIKTSPVWAPDDGDAGGGGGDTSAAPVDASTTLYPDDQPAGDDAAPPAADGVADKATPVTEDNAEVEKPTLAPDADAEAEGDWKPYEDDPAKTPEENAAAKLENDAKHPINQVPADGKYDLQMPDGIELDQPLLDALGPVMAELQLSNGHAQMLVDKYIEAQTASATQRQQEWAQTITKWGDDAKADPEMGGAKWDATVAAATSAVSRFGTPELQQYLEASGAGNHPEVIRLMAKVGAMIGEDVPAVSDMPGKGATASTQEVLYPDDKPKGK